MRLICPNCDAQYEVPDGVVPEAGRDVQCSNCGNTWFQHHADFPPQDTGDTFEDADADEEIVPAPPPAATQVEPTPRPARKPLDPEVADILRQEAQLETRQREAEALESQPDLGIEEPAEEDEGQRRARAVRERTARLRGQDANTDAAVSEAAATAAAIGSRRDLLPDIEEINSTLRSTSDRVASAPDAGTVAPVKRRKRGFRTGFFLMLLLAILAIALYIFAPTIAEAVPALEPALTSYVTWMDGMRLWLDSKIQDASKWLDQIASQSGDAAE